MVKFIQSTRNNVSHLCLKNETKQSRKIKDMSYNLSTSHIIKMFIILEGTKKEDSRSPRVKWYIL